MTEPAPLIFIGASAWVAPASGAAVAPSYPTGLAQDDVVYAVLHIKPDTATVATPTNWSLVGAASGGAGSVGAGTGPTRVHVYKRTVPSGGLTGTQSFTITGGSSPVAHMQAWRGNGSSIVWDAETLTSYSRGTASTAAGGTGAAGLALAVEDILVAVVGTTDDTTTNINITAMTATGATLDPLVKAPSAAQNTNATIVNAQGNDVAAASAYARVASGTSSAAPSVTAAANAAETGMGLFFRISATRAIPTTHSGQATLTGTATITAAGVIVTVHSGQATLTGTATITAEATVEAPTPPMNTSAEPGYATPGAFWPGAVAAPAGMGSSPQVEGQASLTVTASISADGSLTVSSPADTVAAVAAITAAGEWWGAVRGLGVTPISATEMDLDWDPVPGASGYDIERDGVIIATDVAATTYADTSGLAPSTEYDYRVAPVR